MCCRKARGLLDPATRDPEERYCSLGDKLVEMGRSGQKTSACHCIRALILYWKQSTDSTVQYSSEKSQS